MGFKVFRVPLDFNHPLRGRDSYVDAAGELADPPEGTGWQMWTNVNHTPVSPVFTSAPPLLLWWKSVCIEKRGMKEEQFEGAEGVEVWEVIVNWMTAEGHAYEDFYPSDDFDTREPETDSTE